MIFQFLFFIQKQTTLTGYANFMYFNDVVRTNRRKLIFFLGIEPQPFDNIMMRFAVKQTAVRTIN